MGSRRETDNNSTLAVCRLRIDCQHQQSNTHTRPTACPPLFGHPRGPLPRALCLVLAAHDRGLHRPRRQRQDNCRQTRQWRNSWSAMACVSVSTLVFRTILARWAVQSPHSVALAAMSRATASLQNLKLPYPRSEALRCQNLLATTNRWVRGHFPAAIVAIRGERSGGGVGLRSPARIRIARWPGQRAFGTSRHDIAVITMKAASQGERGSQPHYC